jgi:hypothetical protein
MKFRCLMLLALLVLSQLAADVALADASSEAAAQIAAGVALRKQGKNADALAAFQRAYALDESPRALAQIALAQQALADWVSAERGLVEALSNTSSDAWVARNADALRGALATVREHLASVRIGCNVAGAELFVNSQSVGRAPIADTLRVVAGEVVVEARAAEYENDRQQLQLSAGETREVSFQLHPQPTAAATVSAAPSASAGANTFGARRSSAPEGQGDPFASTLAPPAATRTSASSGLGTAAIVTLTAGGLLLGGAIVAHVERERYARGYHGNCPGVGECESWYRSAKLAEALAISGYVSAGLLLATSLVLFAVNPSERPKQPLVGASVTPTSLAVVWSSRF